MKNFASAKKLNETSPPKSAAEALISLSEDQATRLAQGRDKDKDDAGRS